MENNTISKKRRDQAVALILKKRKVVSELLLKLDGKRADNKKSQSALVEEYDQALDKLHQSINNYKSCLVKKPISKSPFTDNEIYSLTIDDFGLDGLWWDAERPIRGVEDEIKSFFALTGSINITGEIPDVPFPLKPGPAVPWVCPRLLNNEHICAVISYMKIGNYDAYTTVYYTNDTSIDIERINTWGTDMYIAEDKDGYAVAGSTFDLEEEYDFDIEPWIKKGKLKWIAINDEKLVLRESIEDCPYINIEGYQYPVLIENKSLKSCVIKMEYEKEESPKNNYGFCTNCGKPLPKGAKFCPYCGAKVLNT